MEKTEFFETAVQHGFYGLDKGGLNGKKDNVRKYWEDISIKTVIRRPILNLLNHKAELRVVDLGCGSGEGYELLTHIPPVNKTTIQRDFVLTDANIQLYLGVDISPSMIKQGRDNFSGKDNVRFIEGNLAADHSFLNKGPFDIYFSSYSSPSHFTDIELKNLLEHIFNSNSDEFVLALDLFGKYSPEWPPYWDRKDVEMHAYNMSWLYPTESPEKTNAENYFVRYWSTEEVKTIIMGIAHKENRKVTVNFVDRSILVGRHMATGFYNQHPQNLRLEVNKLFDRDYRGAVEQLHADISCLDSFKESHPLEYQRISYYNNLWNTTISFLDALMNKKKIPIAKILERAPDELKEEFHMLQWLEGNSSRFPVVDFWASIMGPQVACVLRNLEFGLPEGLGCGHGLFCTVEVRKQ
ncbi:MAG: class I SAM-dependent methyltransferase [Ignavibacteriaceae bacterium]|jgi:SAM-dependent methyltransferase|nr:class I SAM-dependent methyltransferase [Ignavibacteriaceae bacterium]